MLILREIHFMQPLKQGKQLIKRKAPPVIKLSGACQGRSDAGGWWVTARIPRESLVGYPLDPTGTLNATFILNSPDQRFLTAGPAAPGAPNFHRPAAFPPIALEALVRA